MLYQKCLGSAPGKHFLQNQVGIPDTQRGHLGYGPIERRPSHHGPRVGVTQTEASYPARQPMPLQHRIRAPANHSLPRLGAHRTRSGRNDHRQLTIDPQTRDAAALRPFRSSGRVCESRSTYPTRPPTIAHPATSLGPCWAIATRPIAIFFQSKTS